MLKLINLEEGLPTVEEARQKMLRELRVAREQGHLGVKLVHGYGSSGVGGELRISLGRMLQEMKSRGDVATVIYGEDWSISDTETWNLARRHPNLKKDSDLGRRNRGITIVCF